MKIKKKKTFLTFAMDTVALIGLIRILFYFDIRLIQYTKAR